LVAQKYEIFEKNRRTG